MKITGLSSFLLGVIGVVLNVQLVESFSMKSMSAPQNEGASFSQKRLDRRSLLTSSTATAVLLAGSTLSLGSTPAFARLESVNRPDLLPSQAGLNVIQTEPFLTPGQARRMNEMLTNLERDTGFRLRVLCQAYPNTPGLAIRDYWDLAKEVCRAKKYLSVPKVMIFAGNSLRIIHHSVSNQWPLVRNLFAFFFLFPPAMDEIGAKG